MSFTNNVNVCQNKIRNKFNKIGLNPALKLYKSLEITRNITRHI